VKNCYQNKIDRDEEMKGVDSIDNVKQNKRSDQLLLERVMSMT